MLGRGGELSTEKSSLTDTSASDAKKGLETGWSKTKRITMIVSRRNLPNI